MKSLLLIIALISLIFTSCVKEDNLTSSGIQEEYLLEEEGDEIDNYIYEFYQDYGSKIIYDVKIEDVQNVLSSNYSVGRDSVIHIQNRELLKNSIEFLDTKWFSNFSDELKTKYFPLWIFVVDSIIDYPNAYSKDNEGEIVDVKVAETYFAIGNLGESFSDINESEFLSKLDMALFRDHLAAKGLLDIPEDFYAVNKDRYSALVADFDEYENQNNDVKDDLLLKDGFLYWQGKTNRRVFPSRNEDLQYYIEFILSTPRDEVDDLLTYPKQRLKYDVLLNYLENELGIGNIIN